jgi:hypothetical protein
LTGTGQTASASVKVCGASPLTVTKTAVTAYTSNITKVVDKTTVAQSGGSITFNYTVQVTESGWTVSGSITIANPNDWEAITPTSVADTLSDAGAGCTVNGGTPVGSIAASSSISVPYACKFTAALPSAVSGTNSATVNWNAAAAFTAVGTASTIPAVPYAFTSLTVTDTFNGGSPTTLGSIPVTFVGLTTSMGTVTVTTSGSPITATATYKYPRTIPNANPGMCQSFTNTAAIVQTGQSGSQTVTVCNTNTGALTMGFWKNSNGQGIITKSCGGTSGTSLTAFLSQFNPFKDDTATTCKAEATYVSNILSGATCSSTGNTCNPMLRAQMLATALDVFFSTPSLGGNQIGAFNNLGNKTPALGGVAIDLSKICDGGDGGFGGSCPEDARRVFGICTGNNTPVAGCTAGVLGTTVLKMLLYSDFASSVNGSPVATPNTGATWYNQIKGLQVVAKDAFDAINNQIAPIAPSGVGTPSF